MNHPGLQSSPRARPALAWLLFAAACWWIAAAALSVGLVNVERWHRAQPVQAPQAPAVAPPASPREEALAALRADLGPWPDGCPTEAERRLDLDLRTLPYRANWRLQVPVCHPLLKALDQTLRRQPELLAEPSDALANALFGSVSGGGVRFEAQPLRRQLQDGQVRLFIDLVGQSVEPATPLPYPSRFTVGMAKIAVPTTLQVLTPPKAHLWSLDRAPDRQGDEGAQWVLPVNGSAWMGLQFAPAPAEAAAAASAPADPPPNEAAAPAPNRLWGGLRGDLGRLHAFWLALLLALPLLALHRPIDHHGLADLRAAVLALCCVVALSQTVTFVTGYPTHTLPTALQPLVASLWSTGGALQAVVMALLLPLLPLRPGAPRPRFLAWLVLAAAGALLAIAGHGPTWVVAGLPLASMAWAAALALALTAAVLGLAQNLRGVGWAGLAGALAIGLGLLEWRFGYPDSSWLAVPLGLLLGALWWWRLAPPILRPGAGLLGAALLLGLLAWPVQANWAYFSLLGSAVWVLMRLAVLVLLLALLVRALQQDEPQAQATREGVALLLGWWLFWHLGLTPLGVLLSGLSAWLLVRHALFAARGRGRAQAPARLARAIRRIAQQQGLARARRDFMKGLSEQLAKGALSAQDFHARQQAYEDALDAAEPGLRRARAISALALSSGGPVPARQRALQGARLAALISLPWMAFYLWGLMRYDAPISHAYLLEQGLALAQACLQWPLLGAVFGFLYPWLRGHNGMGKGLTMVLLCALPALAALLPAADAESWRWYWVWTLQLFIVCMLLGVVIGDLAVLRGIGKGLRSLFEIYNLGALTAWGSGLLLAVGTALTTLLAGQTSSLAAKGIELLFTKGPGGS